MATRVLYRLVTTTPPTIEDFKSYEALGVPPRRPLSPRDRDRWRGISCYATRAAAIAKSRISPRLGEFVATLRISDERAIRVEQTGRDPDHHTVWAEPAALLGCVVSVEPVEGVH